MPGHVPLEYRDALSRAEADRDAALKRVAALEAGHRAWLFATAACDRCGTGAYCGACLMLQAACRRDSSRLLGVG